LTAGLGPAVTLGLAVALITVSGLAPVRALAGAPRERPAPQPRVEPLLEVVTRATAPLPLFAGPATLELSGRDGAYTWDEVRFGADEVRLSATVRAGERPCGLFLALDDAARVEPAATGSLVASEVITSGPQQVTTHESSVVVDYATAALRLIATCEAWTLRVEPMADPDLVYQVEERSYPVSGRTIRELAAQANQAQDGWAAYANWRTDWQFWWLDSGTWCDITEGEVELQARITYPEWSPPAGVDRRAVARWERFMDNLTIHELGHITLALQGADAIDEMFDAGLTAATCAEVERSADRAATRLHDRFERLNRRYDASTDHGVAQGTGLP
jgi:predicted secreted Zn-dependent protease